MDITALISGFNFGPFTTLSLFFHNYAYSLVAILSLFTFPYLRGKGRYYALACSMALVILLTLAIKDLYAIPRPCNEWLVNAKACPPPDDFGFPSGHTAFAFVFVGASIGTGIFPFYLFMGILIGASRIYLGVHSLSDVAGGAVLGVVTYLFVEEIEDWAMRKLKKEEEKMRELRRKLFHLGLGAIVIGLSLNPDREYAILFLFGAFLAGLGVLSLKLRGLPVPLADELLARLSRKGEPPGYGAFWYIAGMLAILTFIHGTGFALASLLMLGIADGASALIGRAGTHKLPYNKGKSLEGSLAFALISSVSFFWLGPIAISFALLGAIIESIDSRLDDNLRITLFCIVFAFIF